MHPNSIYRRQPEAEALQAALDRGFGVVTAQLETLFGAHVPFIAGTDGTLHLHLHRGNALAKAASQAKVPVMLIVSLCDAYVSPDWYGLGPDQVPTWVYGAVHIHGTLSALPDAALEPMLANLSTEFEGRLPKQPWTLEKMGEKAKQALMRAIQPFALTITSIESTDKFAQNKPAEALEALADAIPGAFGAQLDLVEQRVRHHQQQRQQSP